VRTVAAFAVMGYSFVGTLIIAFLIKVTIGLRVSAVEEMEGLDISEHGMWGYPEAFMPVPGGVYRPADTPTVNPHPEFEPTPATHKEVSPA